MKSFVFVCLVLMVTASSALDCYQCMYYENNNTTNSKCNEDLLPEELLLPCKAEGSTQPKDWQCVKKTGKTVEDELKFTERGCSPGNAFENSCKESNALDSPFGIVEKGFKCYCDESGCNGAETLVLGLPLLLVTLCYNIINPL